MLVVDVPVGDDPFLPQSSSYFVGGQHKGWGVELVIVIVDGKGVLFFVEGNFKRASFLLLR